MSKPYTKEDTSNYFAAELIWRRKELSDIKAAIKSADKIAKIPLLKALITISYAHWEGYVRACATRYFQFLTIRRDRYSDLDIQFYINSYLARFDALHQNRMGIEGRSKLVRDILEGFNGRFSYVNKNLIDTKSNLNTDVVKDICLICSVDGSYFEENRIFIDIIMLKRRNAIAHGQPENIGEDEIDYIVDSTLGLMVTFSNLLENKIYEDKYRVLNVAVHDNAVT